MLPAPSIEYARFLLGAIVTRFRPRIEDPDHQTEVKVTSTLGNRFLDESPRLASPSLEGALFADDNKPDDESEWTVVTESADRETDG